ncbi:MAG: hypothetical protein AAFO82_00120 [Bacteroidota bacterium]
MSKRNNIEDFFNNSLEGFNEQPSEQVWSGIEEMLNVKIPFWKTWKFWGWFSGGACLLIGLVSYHVIMNKQVANLITQNSILLEQNELLNQEVAQTQTALTQIQKEQQLAEKDLKNVKTTTGERKKISPSASKETSAKEQPNSAIIATNQDRDLSINNRMEGTEDTSDKTGNNDLGEQVQASNERIVESNKRLQEEEKNDIRTASMLILSKKKQKSTNILGAKILPIEKLNGQLPPPYSLSDSIAHQAIFALARGNLISPPANKLATPPFKPSLRFALTGSTFSSISNIPNTTTIANNTGILLELQLLRSWGVAGGFRLNRLKYNVTLDEANQNILEHYPNTGNISAEVHKITATHNYVDLPIGIVCKIPLGKKENMLYINSSVACQLYLPQMFEYETSDNELFDAQHNNLYAYFGSAIVQAGYEKKLGTGLRVQLGIWAEESFVEYGIDNRGGTNLGASATLLFGR